MKVLVAGIFPEVTLDRPRVICSSCLRLRYSKPHKLDCIFNLLCFRRSTTRCIDYDNEYLFPLPLVSNPRLPLWVHLEKQRIQSSLWVLMHLPNLILLLLSSGLLSRWLRLGWWTVSSCFDHLQTLAIVLHRRRIEEAQDTLTMVRMIKNLLSEASFTTINHRRKASYSRYS